MNAGVPDRTGFVVWSIRVGCVIGLALVLAQVVRLKVAPSESLVRFVGSRTTQRSLEPVRGDLLDRRGRVLATTRVGSRVVVDPVTVEPRMDESIVALSRELGESPATVGGRIVRAVLANKQRVGEQKKAIRYLPIGPVIEEDAADRIQSLGLPGVFIEHVPERVGTADPLVGSILGKVTTKDWSTERIGAMGVEARYQDDLQGRPGSIAYTRDAGGNPLWVEHGQWDDGENGRDVRLSIDLEIQRIVREELERGAEKADAAGARCVVINPHTGEVLAMDDVIREIAGLAEFPWYDPKGEEPPAVVPEKRDQPRYKILAPDPVRETEPTLARNRCVRDLYEPGSTFKPFAWSLAKTLGLLPDEEILKVEYGRYRTEYNRLVEDVSPHDEMSWDDVLRYSSNVGMAIATGRTPHEELSDTVHALGFGRRTGVGVMGEQSGIVTSDSDWSKWTQTSVGMGYEVAVTPVQMVRAFSVFARQGDMAGTLPELRLSASGLDARQGLTHDEIIVERVFDPEAARRVRGPLRDVAAKMDEYDQRFGGAPAPTYSMFGKSGTSHIACSPPEGLRRPKGADGYYEKQYTSSFLVAAPAEDPKIVVIVVIDDPGPDAVRAQRHYGSWVAGPVVRRIVERVLPYLGVEPDLVDDGERIANKS